MIGIATVTRPIGICGQLKVGAAVFQEDVIETSADGQVWIRFVDGTVFKLSNSARMALKEFFDNRNSNRALVDVARGDFAFISGEMAKAGRFEIDTPVASIRGRSRIGGIGSLSLVSLFFAAMEKVQAADPNVTYTDDSVVPNPDQPPTADVPNYKDQPHGVFVLRTKEVTPRDIVVDDPGVTYALRLSSSSELTISQVSP